MTDGDQSEPTPELLQPSQEPRVAFGRFVKPEMYDVFSEYDLESVTQAEERWMVPEKLEGFVFLENKSRRPFYVDGIGMNAYEYLLIVRSPQHLAQYATARVLGDNEITDERTQASKRAPNHMFSLKLDLMQDHFDKLSEREAELVRLKHLAGMPGFAHETETNLKMLIGFAWQEFTTILDVVHIQRDWDDETRHRAETTLVHYLTQGNQRIRVEHWQSMLDLGIAYIKSRSRLFERRIKAIEPLADKKTTSNE